MSVTQEIKSRLDIIDIVSETVSLRKAGRSFTGFCPFHSNTRTPAFYVFPETQTWHCFGACAEGGDVFSFLMKKEGWDFKEALKRLAERTGVELEPLKSVDKEKQAFENKLIDLMSAAADYYHQLYLYAPQGEAARQYIANRGLSEETAAAFAIGFALDSWDACRTHFTAQGYSDQELLEAGLLTENPDKGTRYDRFRNRLMIPIRDSDGRIVGFGARTLEKEGIPKYLNSPQTPLFDKSSLLFGLDSGKRDIRDARQVVIVEGYMDVMQAWQAGFRNVVAQMGTALTEPQLRQLKKYTKQFVIALDADAAGVKATMRSLQVARETLDRESDVRFDARGLLQHEGRLQADIRIVTLPEGKDPDNIIQDDPASWPVLVEQAKPVVAYVIDILTAALDLEDGKAKTAVAQQIIPLVREINDPVERDHYWQLLARSLRVDERSLRQVRVPKKPSVQTSTPPHKTAAQALSPINDGMHRLRQQGSAHGVIPMASGMREANYLCQCLHYPHMVNVINHKLKETEQKPVQEDDFSSMEDRTILRQMYHWLAVSPVAAKEDLWDSLDEALIDRVQFLLSLSATPESELDRLADKLALSVLDWRLEKKSQLVRIVKQLVHEAQHRQDDESVDMYQQLNELTMAKLNINKARGAMSATSRRRAEDAANGRF
jgi:DNA primase